MLDFSSVVVVNNGSTDETQAWLAKLSDQRIHIIELDNNIGGAGGFHTGSKYICDNISCDWVFFYDDDAYPDSDLLENFSQLENNNYEVYCSLVKDLKGNVCGMNMPFKHIPQSFLDNIRYLKNPSKYIPDITIECDVKTVSFVGMVISKNILSKYYDSIHSELFLYFDDLFFGYQLTLDNHNILFAPTLKFQHDVSIQGRNISPEWKIYYLVRNILLAKRYFHSEPLFSNSSICLRIIKYIILLPLQRKKWLYLSYLCTGVIHGIKGISGKKH